MPTPSRFEQDEQAARLVGELARGRLTRSEFIGRATALGLSATAIGAFLAACGGGDQGAAVATTEEAASGKPRRGGRLRAADRTGGTSDTLDPLKYAVAIDGIRIKLLYDHLVEYDTDFTLLPRLAEEWESTPDGKTWTFRLVEGAEWHDGGPVGADDVIFTVNKLLDPDVGAGVASLLTFMEGADITKLDDRTVRFALQEPYVDFPAIWGIDGTAIISTRHDSKTVNANPIGSGPFKFQSFTPGRESLFGRNENYWREGYPFLDEIQILNIADENARNNALIGGEIDLSTSLSFSSIDVLDRRGAQVIDIPGGTFNVFALVQDTEPFTDQRVREAFALSLDRQQIVDVVYLGRARVGNDHPISDAYPFAPTSIPQRSRDVERAKQLLAEAGYPDGIDVTLFTSDAGFGMIDVAVTAAEQAKETGFRANIKKWPPDSYWSEVWLKKNFYVSFWSGRPVPDILLSSTVVSSADWNEPHFYDEEFDKLVAEARGVLDPDARTEIYTTALQRLHDAASWVIPAYVNLLHGASQKLHWERTPPPNSQPDLYNIWLEA